MKNIYVYIFQLKTSDVEYQARIIALQKTLTHTRQLFITGPQLRHNARTPRTDKIITSTPSFHKGTCINNAQSIASANKSLSGGSLVTGGESLAAPSVRLAVKKGLEAAENELWNLREEVRVLKKIAKIQEKPFNVLIEELEIIRTDAEKAVEIVSPRVSLWVLI